MNAEEYKGPHRHTDLAWHLAWSKDLNLILQLAARTFRCDGGGGDCVFTLSHRSCRAHNFYSHRHSAPSHSSEFPREQNQYSVEHTAVPLYVDNVPKTRAVTRSWRLHARHSNRTRCVNAQRNITPAPPTSIAWHRCVALLCGETKKQRVLFYNPC